MKKLTLISVSTIFFSSGIYAIQSDDNEAYLRYLFSCAAYAYVRTGERDQLKEQITKWENRGYMASREAAITWKISRHSIPTNGDISKSKAEWVRILNDMTDLQREGIGANCRQIFEYADIYCKDRHPNCYSSKVPTK
jgi:hypothetical protein